MHSLPEATDPGLGSGSLPQSLYRMAALFETFCDLMPFQKCSLVFKVEGVAKNRMGIALTNGFWRNWMPQLCIWSNILKGLSLKANWIIANYFGIWVKVGFATMWKTSLRRHGLGRTLSMLWNTVVFHYSSLREWSNVELLHFRGQRSCDLFVLALVCHYGMSLSTLPQKLLELIVS